jgi:hypothetical protein
MIFQRPHAKFQNPRTPTFGEKQGSKRGKKERIKEREKEKSKP